MKGYCVDSIIPEATNKLLTKARETGDKIVVIPFWTPTPRTWVTSIEIEESENGNKAAAVETEEAWDLVWSSGFLSSQRKSHHTYRLLKKNNGDWRVDGEDWRPQYSVASKIEYE